MTKSAHPFYDRNYRSLLPQDKRAAILDLGCGEGMLLRFLSEQGYKSLSGVDRNQASLDAMGDMTLVKLVCADVDAAYLQRHQAAFDLIVLRQMIYYLDRSDVLAFMLALKTALKPGGRVVVEFFNGVLLSSRTTQLKDAFIRTAYTEHSIQRLFIAAGLTPLTAAGVRHEMPKLHSYLYRFLRACWIKVLHGIYILERGYDDELPKIYAQSVIAVAQRPVA
jgi:2-polyprenyl-3-methyl-5-hydroxy-6-metoxy-1,4-benzoquinol methylase